MFDGFTEVKDEQARKRWFASTGTSLVIFAIAGVAILILSRQVVQKVTASEELDVTFAATPEPELKQEAPPPPPPPAPKVKKSGKAAPSSVTAIPEAAPAEAEPTGAGVGEADPEEFGDGEGEEGNVPPPTPPDAAPPPPPPVKDPEPVHEDDPGVTAAEPADANALPVYPEAMRKKGVEALVILRIRISAAGRVSDVKVVKGDEPFASAAVDAVKTWRYQPALLDGVPTPVARLVRIPFRIN
jgi:periplasmic protein TonB